MQPIFIVGFPRSGTTLLRMMLNAHKQIAIPPESTFMRKLYLKYRFVSFTSKIIRHTFLEDLKQTDRFTELNIDIDDFGNYLNVQKPTAYSQVINLVYSYYAQSHNKTMWGDKNPTYIFSLFMIKDVFPKAKVIHIVRDGRDAALSWQKRTDWKFKAIRHPLELASKWCNALESARTFQTSYPNDFFELKYENLVASPEETLKKTSNFLGIPYDRNMLNYYKQDIVGKKFIPEKEYLYHLDLSKKPNPDKINTFLHKMSAWDIVQFQTIASDLLHDKNYSLYYLKLMPLLLFLRKMGIIHMRLFCMRMFRLMLTEHFKCFGRMVKELEELKVFYWTYGLSKVRKTVSFRNWLINGYYLD